MRATVRSRSRSQAGGYRGLSALTAPRTSKENFISRLKMVFEWHKLYWRQSSTTDASQSSYDGGISILRLVSVSPFSGRSRQAA
jgi:hypothetical protein